MNRSPISYLLLLLPSVAFAEPTIRLPETLDARPGRLVVLTAESTGKVVQWVSLSDAADVLPYLDGKALFVAPQPGDYRVLAYTAASDLPSSPAICTIRVRPASPPQPPTPNPPAPNPPAPIDPLRLKLQSLYDAERHAQKSTHRLALVALFREAVRFAEITELQTTAELASRLKSAAMVMLPADALPTIRKAIGEEIGKTLGTNADQRLTPEIRRSAAELFGRIAQAMEELAP